jgi:hypothetical protein
MKTLKNSIIPVYIKTGENYSNIIKYVLKLIEKNQSIKFQFQAQKSGVKLIWDHLESESQFIQLVFYNSIKNKEFKFNLNDTISIVDENGSIDLIASIFYKVNCLQEFGNQGDLDEYERFQFLSSYQYKNGLIKKNLVQDEINLFLKQHSIQGKNRLSKFFISHDIDTIYGSFLQDGLWAVKNKKVGVVLKLILNEISRKPHWRNINKILKISSEYEVYTTFFWLVNQGVGLANIKNSDYKIEKQKDLIDLVENSGSFNGIHKSCSTDSFETELKKSNLNTTINRYHFLKFLPENDWETISQSPIKLDCSLGFSEHYGFRNSYGKAFQPYNVLSDKPYDFIEAPLHFMDTTFHQYLKTPKSKIGDIVIDFYENNNQNCDFSLLWHNTYFTDYKYNSYLSEYKKILGYIYENKIEVLSPNQIIEENKLQW